MPKRSATPNATATENRPTFASLLKQHRVKAGYSQEYLAELSGTTARTIGELERGARSVPSTPMLSRLIVALNVTGDECSDFSNAAGQIREMSASQSGRMGAELDGAFGRNLREVRSAAGVSQDELSRRSGLSKAAISALERGTRRAPQRETVSLLAKALGISGDQLTQFEAAAQRGRARSRGPDPRIADLQHNLPLQLTSLVGRERDVENIRQLVEANGMVSVIGSGGVGKTRVALETGILLTREGGAEVRLVDLSSLLDGTFIVARIASVLDVQLPDNRETIDSLAVALRSRNALLILDGCEHLISDVEITCQALLQSCPQLRILATSRARLRVHGEVPYRLAPLAISPDTGGTIATTCSSGGAEQLLVERTLAVSPDFTFTDRHVRALVDICRRLDGVPLAIELAAARLPMLGLDLLRERLDSRMSGSRSLRDLPNRQQTMRDTIAWSYDLLDVSERSVLRHLSIFAGGCTLDAARAVCTTGDDAAGDVADILASLVDKSLVSAIIAGLDMRYMLLDSTRSFARECLTELGEEVAASRLHARWLADSATKALEQYGSRPNTAWLDDYWPEIDNVRSALIWALASPVEDDALLAGKIAGRLRGLWLVSGQFRECRRWISLILGRIDESKEPKIVADLLTALIQTTSGSEMLDACDRAVDVLRRLDDPRRLATVLSAFAVNNLSCSTGSLTRAQEAIDEAWLILREEQQKERSSSSLIAPILLASGARVQIAAAAGRFQEARSHSRDELDLANEFGDERALIATLTICAEVEFMDGNAVLALAYAREAVEKANVLPAATARLANALCRSAAILVNTQDIAQAKLVVWRALALSNDLGDDELRMFSVENVAALAACLGRPHMAARLTGAVEEWRRTTGNRRRPFEEAAYTYLAASLREQLGPDVQAHLAAGQGMTPESAIELALGIELLEESVAERNGS